MYKTLNVSMQKHNMTYILNGSLQFSLGSQASLTTIIKIIILQFIYIPVHV